jgi:enoyl reductase-like protein
MSTLSILALHLVTPAKAGGHHRWSNFQRQVMDSRLRGNDEVWELRCGSLFGRGG